MTAIQGVSAQRVKYGNGMTALYSKYGRVTPSKKFTEKAAQALLDFDRPARIFTFGNDTVIVIANPSNTEAAYVADYLGSRLE